MKVDSYGQIILEELDLCHLFLKNPTLTINNALTETQINIDPELLLEYTPHLIQYTKPTGSVEEFDINQQSQWFMPDEYKNIDIAQWVLNQCKTDAELQRAGEELILFQQRDMFMLLRYLKYLVDTMRENNIVWGVGRGSSVSSFVLYLIGIHRINSLFYQLDIREFLK